MVANRNNSTLTNYLLLLLPGCGGVAAGKLARGNWSPTVQWQWQWQWQRGGMRGRWLAVGRQQKVGCWRPALGRYVKAELRNCWRPISRARVQDFIRRSDTAARLGLTQLGCLRQGWTTRVIRIAGTIKQYSKYQGPSRKAIEGYYQTHRKAIIKHKAAVAA